MSDPAASLKALRPTKEFFVGIDSDGCVFDSMEIKHKECFCPQYINHFGLQAVSKYAREIWDFVNLYSKSRGVNRFPAVIHALDLARARKEMWPARWTCRGCKAFEIGWHARASSVIPRWRRR